MNKEMVLEDNIIIFQIVIDILLIQLKKSDFSSICEKYFH